MSSRGPSTQQKYPEFLSDQRRFFDELITTQWDTYQNLDWDRSRRFEVDCLFRLFKPRKILDVGCGCGFHDVLMAEKSGVEDVVGIDYSEKSIEAANRIYPHRKVRRRVADFAQMPPGGGYELVVSFQVIEHLKDAGEFLRNCRQQTAPGGIIAVVTPNRLRLSNRLRILMGGQAQLGDPQHYREYVPDDLIALGNLAGLEYFGGFAYGLSLRVPKAGFNIFPSPIRLRIGQLMSPLADCICLAFRNGRQ